MVERTGEKCWLLACNSDLYFTLLRYGVQVKQRLAGITDTKRRCVDADHQPWNFLVSHPVCQYISFTCARARSENEVMTSFSRSVRTSTSLLGFARFCRLRESMRSVNTETEYIHD